MNEMAITIMKEKNRFLFFFYGLRFIALAAILLGPVKTFATAGNSGFGPAFDRFKLILDDGIRTEAAGPFFYSQQKDSEFIWALPPIFSCDHDPVTDRHEDDFFYPLLTHARQFRPAHRRPQNLKAEKVASGFRGRSARG